MSKQTKDVTLGVHVRMDIVFFYCFKGFVVLNEQINQLKFIYNLIM